MREMRTIAIDVTGVCQSVRRLCIMTERIEVLLGVETILDPSGVPISSSDSMWPSPISYAYFDHVLC